MKAIKDSSGFYSFDIKVQGPRKNKILRGLVDTGSSDCACTYQVITTLWIRPVDRSIVSTINQSSPTLIYSAEVGFDNKIIKVPIARVANLPTGIHFLLGMSVLSKCKLTLSDNDMVINWI